MEIIERGTKETIHRRSQEIEVRMLLLGGTTAICLLIKEVHFDSKHHVISFELKSFTDPKYFDNGHPCLLRSSCPGRTTIHASMCTLIWSLVPL